MRLHIGQVIEELARQSQNTGGETKMVLANTARSIVEIAQNEEKEALSRKHERDQAHFAQWIDQVFGMPGRKARNANGTVVMP